MELERVRKTIKRVAAQKGVSEETVIIEIEAAISEAIRSVYASGDKRKIAMWESIPRSGKVPSAEKFVAFISAVTGVVMANEEPYHSLRCGRRGKNGNKT